jgi:hypothetical protein
MVGIRTGGILSIKKRARIFPSMYLEAPEFLWPQKPPQIQRFCERFQGNCGRPSANR